MMFLLALLLATTTASLTVILTMRVNESMLNYDTALTPRHLNFQIVARFMTAHPQFHWLFFVHGDCNALVSFLPFIDCHPIVAMMESFTYKMPYANVLLKRARQLSKQRYLMYTNMDVVFIGDVLQTIADVRRSVREPHLLLASYTVAVRVDRMIDWRVRDQRDAFANKVRSGGRVYEEPGWACEAFIIDRSNPLLDKLPPFLVGRRKWDNWVMQFGVLHPLVAAVDVSEALRVVHLEHGIAQAKDTTAMGASGSEYNDLVAESNGGFNYGCLDCFQLALKNNSVVDQSHKCTEKWWWRPDNVADVRAYVSQ